MDIENLMGRQQIVLVSVTTRDLALKAAFAEATEAEQWLKSRRARGGVLAWSLEQVWLYRR